MKKTGRKEKYLKDLYERYLAPTKEKEFWNKYDKICFDMIEEKQKEYDSENIFSNRNLVYKVNRN